MKILQGDELIEAIKKNNKRMISVCEKAYSVFPKKMTYLSEYVLVSHLIKKEFGFKARMPFERGLKKTIDWYIENVK